MAENEVEHILVIKLGALGDFIQALGPMAAIRRAHPGARITLLTTKPFEGFAKDCGYFDQIWIDERPGLFNFSGWLALRRALNSKPFKRVYDLQNNDRTGFYFKLFRRKPEWVGIAKGASHQNRDYCKKTQHGFDRHVRALTLAGITDVSLDHLDWMKGELSRFSLQRPFVLLVPGCAPSRPEKRWPSSHFARLAQMVAGLGFQPVVIGTGSEVQIAAEMVEQCPQVLDLTSQTSFAQIAALGREAAGAIGNDTGPMHLIGATGCPSLVLFSSRSDPVLHAPKGDNVQVLRRDPLGILKPEEVLERFSPRQILGEKAQCTMH